VTIAWNSQVKDGTRIALEWREAAGTEICAPARTGFGSRLIKLEVTHELNGEVELNYDKSGLLVQLSFPLAAPVSAPAKVGGAP
jgi:two-component sensor histidine kinase